MNTLTSIQNSSDRSAALAPLVAGFYDEAPAALRVRMLREMLRPVGPLALVAIAAGAFSRLLPNEPSQAIEITPETASHIGSEQVLELARYVEQKAPELLGQLPSAVGDNPAWMASVSGALLLLALSKAVGERPH
jgi:hypothetical protein